MGKCRVKRINSILQTFFIITIFILLLPLSAGTENENYTLAVVPQMPLLQIHKNWTPFLERLSREAGINIVLKIYKTIPEFEEGFIRGEPDFAFMNPYHEVIAKRAQGYIPLVRDTKPLTGILVVRRDSPFQSVKDLDGKEIAFPAPNAYAAALYMRALLIEKEKISFTPVYVKTHNNVYRHVILGKASAGGGVNNTLQRESEEVRANLRVIYETPGSAPHPLSAHPRVPKKVRDAVMDAVFKIAEDKSFNSIMYAIQLPKPVKAYYEKDYMPLERLGLEKYVVAGGD